MATVISIDDHLAREAEGWAELTGRSLPQFVEDVIAGELLGHPLLKRADGTVAGPVVVPTFGGDGVVDGLTLDQALARADTEADASAAAGEVQPHAAG